MKPKWQNVLIGSIALCAAMAFFACDADAVQIKRVQSGTINTVDLTNPVSDQSKAFILIYPRVAPGTANSDQNYLFTSEFEDNGTIMLQRAGATVVARVDWYVLEFEDGVRVIRGMSTMKDTIITKIIGLSPPAIDPAKTFTILQCRAAYSNQTYSENLFGTAKVVDPIPPATTSTTIEINRGCSSGAATCKAAKRRSLIALILLRYPFFSPILLPISVRHF
jgi:hypothetical protein